MKMKFKFEDNLPYQNEAINSIINIFNGISTKEGLFSISRYNQNTLFNNDVEIGVGNQINTNNWVKEIANKNVHLIQEENGLKVTSVNEDFPTFDVEMETGTGKTYVFLKTILTLSQKYDFKKFIIIVPSIAIKEGVKKTLDITKEHFTTSFPGIRYNFYDYDSSSTSSIWSFSKNNSIEIMIMNIQQMNKLGNNNESNKNVLYKNLDSLSGNSPIELIRQTNPIIIIDEPQSTASGEKSIKSIENLNPLFILRYSATFKKRKNENLVYQLDACDAYNKKLVKKIIVYSSKVGNKTSNDLIRLISVDIKNQKAKIEIEQQKNNLINLVKLNVKQGDSLYEASNKLEKYKNMIIDEINFIDFTITINGKLYYVGTIDSSTDDPLKEIQIKKTIEEHLEKQYSLKKIGIKVLSLFFIDEVENYRRYDKETGEPILGKYAQIFEKHFKSLIEKNQKYLELFKIEDASKVHDGYFSIDKNKKFKNTSGDSKDDISTYDKIMKDKERLLSFDEKLSFIFSHSALREGWDNPNVFQICTLNDTKSEMKKRQEIGRGLRLCVDQNGNRIKDEKINNLSIMTNNSYEDFAEKLQKELEEDGIIFGKINENTFFEEVEGISKEISGKLISFLITKDIINKNGKATQVGLNEINQALDEFEHQFNNKQKEQIVNVISKSKKEINLINGNKSFKNHIKKEVLESEEFKKLWDAIKQKTIFNIKFNTNEFISNVNKRIDEDYENWNLQNIAIIKKADLNITKLSGVEINKESIDRREKIIDNSLFYFPDFISDIEKATKIKRETIIEIMSKNENIISGIKMNYEIVRRKLIDIINYEKKKMMVQGIEYKKIDDFYNQRQLEEAEKEIIYENSIKTDEKEYDNKYPFEYIQCDSSIERDFANDSLTSNEIKKFIKLPRWFKINTPLGTYNPDWALYNRNNLAFVAETKGSTEILNLRRSEKLKIKCGEKHFQSINKNLILHTTDTFENLIKKIKEPNDE